MAEKLAFAAVNGDTAAIQDILSAASTEEKTRLLLAQDGSCRTALHFAAKNGRDAAVQALLSHAGGEESKAKLLLVQANEGSTALHCAAYKGHEAACRTLLASLGGEEAKLLLVQNGSGRTALHEAARYGHEAACRVLLASLGGDEARGRLLGVRDNWGKTASDRASGAVKKVLEEEARKPQKAQAEAAAAAKAEAEKMKAQKAQAEAAAAAKAEAEKMKAQKAQAEAAAAAKAEVEKAQAEAAAAKAEAEKMKAQKAQVEAAAAAKAEAQKAQAEAAAAKAEVEKMKLEKAAEAAAAKAEAERLKAQKAQAEAVAAKAEVEKMKVEKAAEAAAAKAEVEKMKLEKAQAEAAAKAEVEKMKLEKAAEAAAAKAEVEKLKAEKAQAEAVAAKAEVKSKEEKAAKTETVVKVEVAGRKNQGRWGDNLDAPAAGARDFFPPGWTPERSVYPAIKAFGFSDEEITAVQKKGSRLERELKEFDVSIPEEYAAAIYAYTVEDDNNDVYKKLNAACRGTGGMAERRLATYRDYMYHLERALSFLPPYRGNVFRGIKTKVNPESYRTGAKVTWQSFSSTSRSQNVAKKFVNCHDGQLSGSMFIIHLKGAKEIDSLSEYPDEEEVLLSLNTFMVVKGKVEDEATKKENLKDLATFSMGSLDVFVLEQI